jgi:hypothetical protein
MELVWNDPNKTEKQKDITYIVSDDGCHICTSHATNSSGYPVRSTIIGTVRIQRYMWYLKTGQREINYNEAILMTCGNRRCINLEHIYLADRLEQNRRKAAEGRVVRHSSLTDEQVYEIKTNITETSIELADEYNVSDSNIRAIWMERTFSHIEVDNYQWYIDQRRKRLIETRINQTKKANKRRQKA